MIAPQYPFHEFKHEFHTIQELIDWAGHTYHDHDAFRFYQGAQIVSKTYGEFLLDVQCAGRFFATCCSPQDHIAIVGNTSYLWMVAWAGAVSAGFVAVPVDRLLSEDDIAFLLKQADVSVLVFDASCVGMIAAMQDKCPQINYICMNGQNLGNMRFDMGIQEQKNAEKPTWINKVLPQDVAEIVFTSGTTGSYKGCVLTHDNLAWNAMNGSSYVALTPEKKTLSILPIHHTLEITAGMLTPFCSGVTICINDSLRNIQRNLNVFHPECMIAVPMVVEMLYKNIWITAKRFGKEKILHMALHSVMILTVTSAKRRSTLVKAVFISGSRWRMYMPAANLKRSLKCWKRCGRDCAQILCVWAICPIACRMAFFRRITKRMPRCDVSRRF